ncbi:hypothetical protein RAS1_35200 [Phycisphaerae bacterium RAS1]|nr:hypothetical protein RAS1_35200 [Phycisphaerae bacterium RAS1]
MASVRKILVAIVLGWVGCASAVWADTIGHGGCGCASTEIGGASRDFTGFVPGRVYVTHAGPPKQCTNFWGHDAIWEMDPVSGSVTRLIDLGDCRSMGGGAFRPDGGGLRVVRGLNNQVLEFGNDGQLSPVYGFSDGLVYPQDVAYDRDGNFFVMNFTTRQILKFADDNGPSQHFAIADGPGHLTFAASGNLFFAGTNELPGPRGIIRRYRSDGSSEVFDTFSSSGSRRLRRIRPGISSRSLLIIRAPSTSTQPKTQPQGTCW